MSELMNNSANAKKFQWQLLTTVSVFALLGAVYCASNAKAADDDSEHPSVWIELGGQLNRLDDGQEAFAPSLMAVRPSIFTPSQKFERLPLYSIDEDGRISFQPETSDWVFSASVHYGRSVSDKHVHQQTYPQPFVFYKYYSGANHKGQLFPNARKFADTNAQNNEHHLIVDFQAGKDVGLGMFGSKDGSSLNLGVRFAQFGSKSNIAQKSDPDWQFTYKYQYGLKIPKQPYHSNAASLTASRNFHGIGPSITWNASAPLMGNSQSSKLTFDWGVNAALLFGRQRAQVHHQTTGQYAKPNPNNPLLRDIRYIVGTPVNTNHTRSRSVTVPNVGGFAGVSFGYSNAKVSFGYRGDFFFGAMDGGIDAAKKENVGFYGPFASVSVGL